MRFCFSKLKIVYGVSTLLILASCATILNPSGRNITIELTSTPEGAEVYDKDGKFLGKTPVTIHLPRVNSYQVTLKKKGYQTRTHTFLTGQKRGLLLLDALLLCIPCAVDVPMHSFNKIIDPKLNSNLRKERATFSDTLFFSLWEPEYALQKEEYIGTYRKEKMYFKLNDYVIGSRKPIQNMLCNASQNCFIRFNSCSQNQTNLLDFVATVYAIKPVVKKLNTTITSTRGKDFGKGHMVTEWQVIDMRGGKTKVRSFETDCELSTPISVTRSLVDSLFMESYYKLLDIDSVYETLAALSKATPVTVKAGKITLKKNQRPAFEKTRDLVKHVSQAVVTVSHPDGFGSGFIISSDGLIVTNYHVVKERRQVQIKLNNGTSLTADVVQTDSRADLALLKISGTDFVSLIIGNSDSVALGEDVLAIGTPTSMELGQTITKGIVSGKRKVNDMVYIQTDVSINEGNSGGPLINENGEAIGIITMKITGDGVEGLGFCIPANKVFEVFGLMYSEP